MPGDITLNSEVWDHWECLECGAEFYLYAINAEAEYCPMCSKTRVARVDFSVPPR